MEAILVIFRIILEIVATITMCDGGHYSDDGQDTGSNSNTMGTHDEQERYKNR
jgi:hypothetical protein